MHSVRVTLVTGQVLTLQVDVPAGTQGHGRAAAAAAGPAREIEDLGPLRCRRPIPTPSCRELPIPTPDRRPRPPDRCPRRAAAAEAAAAAPAAAARARCRTSRSPAAAPRRRRRPRRPSAGRRRRDRTPSPLDAAKVKKRARKVRERAKEAAPTTPGRNVDGTPTIDNPTYSLALPGPAPIGVPNFFIDKFRIPPFLLPIYQAAGIQYGVRWEVLAAINEIETDYGRNLNISSAGALGWMQFMPATWKMYGVDANRDGEKDPFNPVDAIFAAARYLRAAGAETDIKPRDLRLQPRRLVRRLRPPARPGHRRPAEQPRRLAHRPHPGPLPRPRQGHLRRRHLRARPQAPQGRGQQGRRRRVRRRSAAASRSTRGPGRR